MKNVSIRTKIMIGVFLVNFVGMVVVMVYLHQSYSGGLDVEAQRSVTIAVNAWNGLSEVAQDEFGPVTSRESALKYVEALNNITGDNYGLLLDKTAITREEYAKQLEAANIPDNWDERETYVMLATTDEALAESMQLNAAPDSVPEIGKLVGVENGACSKMCHGAMTGSGDFWKVRWSKDSSSRAHTVFPIVDNAGKPIGIVYSIQDISKEADAARESQVRTMIVISVGLLIATILIGWMLNAFVFRRLNKMIITMEDISVRVAGGDFGARFIPDGSSDEIGKFEQFFARFMDLMSGTLQSLVKK